MAISMKTSLPRKETRQQLLEKVQKLKARLREAREAGRAKNLDRVMARAKLAEAVLYRTGHIVIVCDLQGRIIQANMHPGLRKRKILLMPFDKTFPLLVQAPEGGHVPFSIGSLLRKRCSIFSREAILPEPSGNRFFLLNSMPLYEGRKIIGAVITLADITERKLLEEALQKREESYRNILDLSPAAVTITRLEDGRFRQVNKAFCRNTGYTPEEVIGRSTSELNLFVDPDGRKRLLEALSRGKGRVENLETRYFTKNGTVLNRLLSAQTIHFEGEDCLLVVATNINELKIYQETLRQREEHFRGVLETMQEGYHEVDLRGNYTFVNDTLCQMHGRTKEKLLGMSYKEYMDTETCAQIFKRYNRVFKTGEPIRLFESEIIRADGVRISVETSASLIRNSRGEPIGFRGINRDITDRKMMENELRRSKDELERRVEARTAELTKITEFLRGQIASRERAEESLRDSEKSLRFLSSQLITAQENERKIIAQELHDSIGSNLSAIKHSLETKILKVNSRRPSKQLGLDDVLSLLQATIEENRSIQLNLRPSILDDLGIRPTISWYTRETQKAYPGVSIEESISTTDREIPENLKLCIFRVIQEAVNNAIRHGRSTVVRIGLDRRGKWLQLKVEDNGKGFDSPPKRSLETGGMGLGSMQQRVESSGGVFSVTSEVGKGTTISAEWRID